MITICSVCNLETRKPFIFCPARGGNAIPSPSPHADPSAEGKPLVYLAVPYSHPDPEIREFRFDQVNQVAARLMHEGEHIFSPISHTHPIAKAGELPTGWEYWQAYDRAILSVCHKLIVLKLDGWNESLGVAGEIKIAEDLGIPIEYIDAAPSQLANGQGGAK